MQRFGASLIAIAILAVILAIMGQIVQGVGAALAVAALCVAGLLYLLMGSAVLAIFLRAALAILPVGLAVIVLVGFFVEADWLEDGETRALIAAAIVASGWIVTFVTAEMRQVNQEQERRRDIIRAAMSEIELIIELSQRANWKDIETETLRRMDAEEGYRVFVLYGHQFSTIARLAECIEVLERHQIRPFMDLFQLLDRLKTIEGKLEGETFSKLPQPRQKDAVSRYLRLQSQVKDVGAAAHAALKARPYHGVLRGLS